MAAESIWRPRPTARKFQSDPDLLIPAVNHPLRDTGTNKKLAEFWTRWESKKGEGKKPENQNKETYDFDDPLGATFGTADFQENVDKDILQQSTNTIRKISLDNTLENKKSDRPNFDIELPDFQPWREKRAQIASVAKPREFEMSKIDILKARLKSLADEKNPKNINKTGDMSQKFLMFRENLITAWGREDRVESFKIVTESAHQLQLIPPNSEEYPYFWLLAIDVIDTFGQLLYDRLFHKSNEARNKNGQTDLPANFNEEQVPKNVKDMAMNWFLKLSEIIDIPVRFYIECSMIACLKFFDEANVSTNLERLALMCSQFPDDLSSIFARVHISRYSMMIDPLNRFPHWRVLHDWMQSPKDVLEERIKRDTPEEIRKLAASIHGIAWIVQCIAHRAHTVDDLVPLFAYCRKSSPFEGKTFILVSAVIDGLPSKYLAVHAEQVLDIIFAFHEGFEEPLTRLGKRFLLVPPIEENRKFVKRSVWMRVADISNFRNFVDCCAAWVSYIAKYYSLKDINRILELVLVRLTLDDQTKNAENHNSLVELIASFLEHTANKGDCLQIVTSSSFVKMVDIIGYDIQSTSDCSRRILNIFTKNFEKHSISDVDACQFIIEKCRTMCKPCRLEETEEIKIVENLVCTSLSLIDFQTIPSFDQRIELIIRCREDMGLRQRVLTHIIQCLFDCTQFVHLSMEPGKRKAHCMRVCITTLSLTIPAVRDASRRIRMTVQNIQMCLLANFLPQIVMSTERIIDYVTEMSSASSSSCATVSPLISCCLSTLCFCPDGFSDETPSLSHFKKLLNIVERNHEDWSKESKGIPLAEIYINMLRYLCTFRRSDSLKSDIKQNFHFGDNDHLTRVDSYITDVITKLFSLANEPTIAVITLENVVMLFQMHEEMRSTIRGLLKRSVGAPPHLQKRLEAIIQDLRNESKYDESVLNILQRLSLL